MEVMEVNHSRVCLKPLPSVTKRVAALVTTVSHSFLCTHRRASINKETNQALAYEAGTPLP